MFQCRLRAGGAGAEVDALNLELARIAAARGWRFVDLNMRFADADGLKPGYSYDGIHLNGAGYRLWREMIGAEIAAALPPG